MCVFNAFLCCKLSYRLLLPNFVTFKRAVAFSSARALLSVNSCPLTLSAPRMRRADKLCRCRLYPKFFAAPRIFTAARPSARVLPPAAMGSTASGASSPRLSHFRGFCRRPAPPHGFCFLQVSAFHLSIVLSIFCKHARVYARTLRVH